MKRLYYITDTGFLSEFNEISNENSNGFYALGLIFSKLLEVPNLGEILAQSDSLIFTSKAAIFALDSIESKMQKCSKEAKLSQLSKWRSLPIFALGSASAKALDRFNIKPFFVGKTGYGDDFAKEILGFFAPRDSIENSQDSIKSSLDSIKSSLDSSLCATRLALNDEKNTSRLALGDKKCDDNFVLNNKKFTAPLFLSAKIVASNLANILLENKINLKQIALYETSQITLNKEQKEELKPQKDSIIFFSAPSRVCAFLDNFEWDFSCTALCIGKTTQNAFLFEINKKYQAQILKNPPRTILSPSANIKAALEFAKNLL